jgi:lipopolysaccharide export system protein LptA
MTKSLSRGYRSRPGHVCARLLCLSAVFFLLFLQTASWAAEKEVSDQQETLYIDADYMQLDINAGKSVYRGNVKISQGELVLTGDEVTLEQSKDKVERLTITGKPVRYDHVTEKGESIQAESERMVYIASQHKLIMTVNAKLLQPDHQVSSQIITYDTKNKIIIAGDKSNTSAKGTSTGEKQRVNITLTPKK